jgi:tetratricopeptide (TPR) repeat protein
MTSKPNSFVPPAAEIRRALSGLGASDVVMLMRQSLELRGFDHAVAIAEALDDERRHDSGVRICEAVARFVGGEREQALGLLDEVLARSPDHLVAREVRAEMLLRSGRRAEALEELVGVARRYPDYPGLQGLLSVLLMPGPHYKDVLGAIHQKLAPLTYLEIGVETGQTLALATTAEVAVGVDPAELALESPLPPGARVVRLTSDDFFERYTRHDIFGERRLDLAFIDGMHLFEFALRDFIHCERWCDPWSTIVMHDCLPILPVSAERERRTRFWVGDTWKAVVAIARRRPDLKIRTILAPPSGLVVIRRLNPSSTRLSEELDSALAELADATYDYPPGTYPPEFHVVPNDAAGLEEALS